MEDRRCKLGLAGRRQLVRLMERGATFRQAAACPGGQRAVHLKLRCRSVAWGSMGQRAVSRLLVATGEMSTQPRRRAPPAA